MSVHKVCTINWVCHDYIYTTTMFASTLFPYILSRKTGDGCNKSYSSNQERARVMTLIHAVSPAPHQEDTGHIQHLLLHLLTENLFWRYECHLFFNELYF